MEAGGGTMGSAAAAAQGQPAASRQPNRGMAHFWPSKHFSRSSMLRRSPCNSNKHDNNNSTQESTALPPVPPVCWSRRCLPPPHPPPGPPAVPRTLTKLMLPALSPASSTMRSKAF